MKDLHENKEYLADKITGLMLLVSVLGGFFFVGYKTGTRLIEKDAISTGNAIVKDGQFRWKSSRGER